MYKINKLNQLIEDYHVWLKKYNFQLDLIEETILQKDIELRDCLKMF